jgi:hypothetical protein
VIIADNVHGSITSQERADRREDTHTPEVQGLLVTTQAVILIGIETEIEIDQERVKEVKEATVLWTRSPLLRRSFWVFALLPLRREILEIQIGIESIEIRQTATTTRTILPEDQPMINLPRGGTSHENAWLSRSPSCRIGRIDPIVLYPILITARAIRSMPIRYTGGVRIGLLRGFRLLLRLDTGNITPIITSKKGVMGRLGYSCA